MGAFLIEAGFFFDEGGDGDNGLTVVFGGAGDGGAEALVFLVELFEHSFDEGFRGGGFVEEVGVGHEEAFEGFGVDAGILEEGGVSGGLAESFRVIGQIGHLLNREAFGDGDAEAVGVELLIRAFLELMEEVEGRRRPGGADSVRPEWGVFVYRA